MQYAQRVCHLRDGSYLMGLVYEEGLGVEVNRGEAQRCFFMAAAQFHPLSEVRMAVYSRSQGNHERALKWILPAIEHDQPEATYILGLMYYDGEGVPQDRTKAEELIREAAQRGIAAAIISLSLIYMKRKDFACAMAWLRKAEDSLDAQNLMGHMYFSGMGVEPNAYLAREMFQKSADKGNVHSMHALARMHRVGYGVELDFDKAIEYYTMAADKGHLESEVEKAECYEMGQNAPLASGLLFGAIELGSAEADAMSIYQAMEDLDDTDSE